MTFSDKTKLEIISSAEHFDLKGYIAGIVRGNLSLTIEKGKIGCQVSTDLSEIAMFLLSSTSILGAELVPEQKRGLNTQKVFNLVYKGKGAEEILKNTGIMEFADGEYVYSGDIVPEWVEKNEECTRSYVAGIFLTAGEVYIPDENEGKSSSYQLEFVFASDGYAKEFSTFLTKKGFACKLTERKESSVVYLKESEIISDLLAYVGAVESVLEIQNVKVYRSVRNKANRISNCEIGNIGKVVDAAQRQINAIKELKKTGKLNLLPEKLKEVAEIRLTHPEDKLDSLAELLGISKSCINHRLRKLESIARGEE